MKNKKHKKEELQLSTPESCKQQKWSFKGDQMMMMEACNMAFNMERIGFFGFYCGILLCCVGFLIVASWEMILSHTASLHVPASGHMELFRIQLHDFHNIKKHTPEF